MRGIIFFRNPSSHLSHQLGVDFGDAVDGARSLHAEIGRRVAGRGGTEGPDGAGDKQAQAMLRCNVQDVVEPWGTRREKTPSGRHTSADLSSLALVPKGLTGDVHGAGQGHVGLPHRAEEGAVVNQPCDAVVHHNFPQVLVVQDVGVDEGA